MVLTALWVVPVPEIGGVARHVLDVAEVGLPGWRLVVLCPEGPLADALRDRDCAVVTGPFGPAAGARASVRTLRRTVLALRPAVVHTHLSYADVIGTLAVLGTPCRLVSTEHGIAADDLVYHGSRARARARALLHRLRLRRANLLLAVSQATRTTMQDKWHPTQPITVIPNGVDPEEVRRRLASGAGPDSPATPSPGPPSSRAPSPSGSAAATPPTGPRVLSLSRLSAEKRIDQLLRAFAELRRDHPDATLTVAGDGPDRAALERLAADLGLTGQVRFTGFVDPGPAMAAADVVVQLSVWENCSYTLLDAAAAGLGVVATPVGGNPEILPAECLVTADDPVAVARTIAAEFGRTRQPFRWPSRQQMAGEIVAGYRALWPDSRVEDSSS